MSKKKKPTAREVKERKERKRLNNQKYYYKKKYKEATYTKAGKPRKRIDADKQQAAKYHFENALEGIDKLRQRERLRIEKKAREQVVKLEVTQNKKAEFETTLGPYDYYHKQDFINYVMFNTTNTYYKDKADKRNGIESNYAPGYITVTKKPKIKLKTYLGIDLETNLDEALESISSTFEMLLVEGEEGYVSTMEIEFFQKGRAIIGYEIES